MTDPLRAALARGGARDLTLMTGWNGPEAAGCEPADIDARIRAIALDVLIGINRERRGRLDRIERNDRDRGRLFATIADACVEPLLIALAGPEGRLVQIAYRLYLARAIETPRAEWWTPRLGVLLGEVIPTVYRGQIGGVSAMLHEMQNGFVATWPFRDLPLTPEERPVLHGMLTGVIISTLSAELDFAGRIFR